MTELTLPDLMTALRECAGEEESPAVGGDVGGTDFAELGYDSLALMEVTGKLSRTYAVVLPEDGVLSLRTPAELVAFVNARLAVR